MSGGTEDEHAPGADSGHDPGEAGRPAPDGEPASEPARHGLPELISERRAKAQRLRETDPQAFPYAFADAEPVSSILLPTST